MKDLVMTGWCGVEFAIIWAPNEPAATATPANVEPHDRVDAMFAVG